MAGNLQGAAAEYLRDRYRGELTEREDTVTVGTTVTSVVPSDPDRLGLVIINNGTDTVWVRINENLTVDAGIRLGANGGAVSLNIDDDGMILTREWFGISTSAGMSVDYVELRRFIASRQIAEEEAS